MKTYQIEIQKVKAMANHHGLIHAQIDARVEPGVARGDATPTTMLILTEDQARVLQLLLKAQLAEFDARKAKSRR